MTIKRLYIAVICMGVIMSSCSSKTTSTINEDNNLVHNNTFITKVGESYENQRYGIVDLDGKTVLDFQYNSLHYIDDSYTLLQACNKDNGEVKCGLINIKGEVIIPFKFYKTWLSSNKKEMVCYDRSTNKTEIYNLDGKKQESFDGYVYFPFDEFKVQADELSFDEFGGVSIGKYGLSKLDGTEVLKKEYENIAFITTYDKEVKTYNPISIYIEKDGKSSLLDMNGNEIIPMEYGLTEEQKIQNGMFGMTFSIQYNEYTDSYLVNKFGKQGVLDRQGNVIIEPKYDEIYVSQSNEYLARVANDTENYNTTYQYTYFDTSGKEILKMEAQHANVFAKNGLASIKKDNSWRIIDRQGKEKAYESLKDKDIIYLDEFDNEGNMNFGYEVNGVYKSALLSDKDKLIIDLESSGNFNDRFENILNENHDFPDYGLCTNKTNTLNATASSAMYALTKYKAVKMSEEGTFNIIDKTLLWDMKGKEIGVIDGGISSTIITDTDYFISLYQHEYLDENYENSIQYNGLMTKDGKVLLDVKYLEINVYDDYISARDVNRDYVIDKKTFEVIYEQNIQKK